MMKTSKQVEQELEEVKIELGTYESCGSDMYFWGKIKTIENELKVIKLIEETEKLPKPVFKRRCDEYVPSEENYRVFKVTPKRIYLKRINKEPPAISEVFVNKDGSGSILSFVMDIPETLKVWEEYINNKT